MIGCHAAILAAMFVACSMLASADERPNIGTELSWKDQPAWLANPAASSKVTRTRQGLRFRVSQAGMGMKWSAQLPQPVDLSKTPWVAMRYRAVDAAPPPDYFVYLGGDASEEQNIVEPGDLISDGAWHTIVARAKPFTAKWVAVQLQASGAKAEIELSRLEFLAEKPKLAVEDLLAIGEAKRGEFVPVSIAPICNSGHQVVLDEMNLRQWFQEREVAVSGVPFHIEAGVSDVAASDADKPSEIRAPLPDVEASEIFLLVAATSKWGKFRTVTEPHQFTVRVSHAQGRPDVWVPASVAGKAGLSPGLGVYAIPVSPGRLKELLIRDNIAGVKVNLIAVTLGIGTNLSAVADRPSEVAGAKPYAPVKREGLRNWSTSVSGDGDKVELSDGRTRFTLRLKPGISMEIRSLGPGPRIYSKGSLWRVRVGDRELQSTDFVGKLGDDSGRCALIELSDREGLGIRGRLRISPWRPGSIDLGLELESSGRRVQVVFPTLPDVKHLDGADLSYCFPCRGAVVNNIPISLRVPYSGAMPLQFMDVYGPDGGVYMLTRDLAATYRYFLINKSPDGVSLGMEYMEQEVTPSSRFTSVATVIGFHDGDWHTAFGAYKDWVKGWYKPDAPRKEWFRRVFNFRQQFLRMFFTDGRYFNKETRTLTFAEGIAQDAKTFGGVDYLHLFDWGLKEKGGALGDYDAWDEIGGKDAFRQAVQQTQSAGMPVGLYMEGYLVDPKSRIGQAHGKEWEILDAQGKPLPFFPPAMNVCSAVTAWQDYLSALYGSVKRETGAMGYYCDEMGFAGPDHLCYAANHGHGVPEPPLRGQIELLRKIRDAIGPDVALYTEETPCDVGTQHQDGSFTYNITFTSDAASPSHINLTRFALPDFKTFEIILCDKALGDRLTSVRQIFFNGEGIWLEGPADWFAPEALDFIRKMHAVMTEYADCFTSLSPVPLVPTGNSLVFANQFPAQKRVLWTLFNANYSTVRGELLAVRHTPGAKYRDVWNGRDLKPRITKGITYLNLELGPRDVGCIVKELPR